MEKLPFFAASKEEEKSDETEAREETEEEEIERMVQEELGKKKRMSNLRNEKGVDYAPWMRISEEDEENIRKAVIAKTAARKARQEQEKDVSGSLYLDSQAQELSGTGLKAKIIDEDVELEWATRTETDCKGFKVLRRPAKTSEFTLIASYEDFGPLVSQGPEGGIYRYFDDTAGPGGWVYRISEASVSGEDNDLCQCLVEVETAEEKRAGLIAGVGISVLAIAAIAAGILIDPMQ